MLMGIFCAGCLAAAAAQFIPLGIQAAEFGGVALGSAVTGKDPTEDTQDSAERCDQLAATPPYLGELVHTSGGAMAVRGLMLGTQGGKPAWFATTTVTGFDSLRFVPPLSGAEMDPEKHPFLAFAPSQPLNEAESNQLVALLGSFVTGPGMLSVNGKTYRYAWVGKLPCFQPAH
jgi:hypothetical protein